MYRQYQSASFDKCNSSSDFSELAFLTTESITFPFQSTIRLNKKEPYTIIIAQIGKIVKALPDISIYVII